MADISKLPVITIGREYGAGGRSIIRIAVTALIGIFGVSAGLEGYLKGKINPVIRIALVVSGVLLIVPSILTDIIGAVAIALSIMCQIFLSRKLS